MGHVFEMILNMSLTAGLVILAVMLVRLALKKGAENFFLLPVGSGGIPAAVSDFLYIVLFPAGSFKHAARGRKCGRVYFGGSPVFWRCAKAAAGRAGNGGGSSGGEQENGTAKKCGCRIGTVYDHAQERIRYPGESVGCREVDMAGGSAFSGSIRHRKTGSAPQETLGSGA